MIYDDFIFLNQLMAAGALLSRIPELTYHHHARELVYQDKKVKLYHYQPQVKKPHAIPLLVVFATVNRPEILDLFPDNSLIGGLLKQGMDVYLLDWGYADQEDTETSFNDYVTRYLAGCIQFIFSKTKQEKINLLGICQGGVICLCYAALFKQINNLVLISTPIDFHTRDNVIAKLMARIDAEEFIKNKKNIAGQWLTQFFINMRPFELLGKKYLHLLDHLTQVEVTDKFLQVEKWLHDAPDQPCTAFSELVKNLYQNNQLIKGEFCLNSQKITLSKLTLPILNIMAREDEIVPMSASRVLKKYVGTKHYTQKIFPSGHIGIYISDKVGNRLAKTIARWLKQAKITN